MNLLSVKKVGRKEKMLGQVKDGLDVMKTDRQSGLGWFTRCVSFPKSGVWSYIILNENLLCDVGESPWYVGQVWRIVVQA